MLEDKKLNGRWVTSTRGNGTKLWTRSYVLWQNMIMRCKKNKNYIDCSISDEFQDFQLFTDWCHKQIGYGLEGYSIDKDILIPGNRVYSTETCVFVPQALNSFLTFREALRGEFALGVCFHKVNKNYIAAVHINGDRQHIGSFEKEDAYVAYKNAKEAEARRWAQRLRNREFIVDERVINALESYSILEKVGQSTPELVD